VFQNIDDGVDIVYLIDNNDVGGVKADHAEESDEQFCRYIESHGCLYNLSGLPLLYTFSPVFNHERSEARFNDKMIPQQIQHLSEIMT
jgi:hypothetical protein